MTGDDAVGARGPVGGEASYYWYDLETTGTQPKWDRIVQFAAIRTNLALEEVGDESCFFVKLHPDTLPDPGACLVTGLTPQQINSKGVTEVDALQAINKAFSTPQTCVVGYNSLRFDDEFIRYAFYRNFLDPYAREWQNRNSRWDLIDLIRATAALRPNGINWPEFQAADDSIAIESAKGKPGLSFRLEHLSQANGLEHTQAHDALSDVRATIGLARLVKNRQPKLFDYYLSLRNKHTVLNLLKPFGEVVYVHVSGMYPRSRQSIAPVMSICNGPDANSIIVLDLMSDIDLLIDASEEELHTLLFTRHEGTRPGIKEIKVNRCPFVAKAKVLGSEDQSRLNIDLEAVEQVRRRVCRQPDLMKKISRIYAGRKFAEEMDVEAQLYEGGFLSSHDKHVCQDVWDVILSGSDEAEINKHLGQLRFDDHRMTRLLLHLRARGNYAMLTDDEKTLWQEIVRNKLLPNSDAKSGRNGPLSLNEYYSRINQVSVHTENQSLLNELRQHGQQIEAWLENFSTTNHPAL